MLRRYFPDKAGRFGIGCLAPMLTAFYRFYAEVLRLWVKFKTYRRG
jgi:hypothetical protein